MIFLCPMCWSRSLEVMMRINERWVTDVIDEWCDKNQKKEREEYVRWVLKIERYSKIITLFA